VKARAILGKRVVAVEQERVMSPDRRPAMHIRAIVFDDGTRLAFAVTELEGDYAITATAYRNGKEIG
jgi:hypothetical protein